VHRWRHRRNPEGREKRWAFGAGVFLQLLVLGVTYEMARGGFWPGAMLLGRASVWRRCCVVLDPGSGGAGPVLRLSCGAT
jgi:hypothetical protein